MDGHFTSSTNDIGWFVPESGLSWSSDILRRVDALLFGRETYEGFRQFWPTAEPAKYGIDPFIIERVNHLP